MVGFLTENGGTILVLVIVAAIVALVVRNMHRNKKAGKSSCGCGCADCPSSGACHPPKK